MDQYIGAAPWLPTRKLAQYWALMPLGFVVWCNPRCCRLLARKGFLQGFGLEFIVNRTKRLHDHCKTWKQPSRVNYLMISTIGGR